MPTPPKLNTTPNPDGNDNVTNENVTNDNVNRKQESRKSPQDKKWKFKDYLRKFEPSTIWEQIDKQKKYNGLILSNEEQSEIMIRAMDPTDEILKLKIENGAPKMFINETSRRVFYPNFEPKGGFKLPLNDTDHWMYRTRLYELMKQAIYTTRNKMVIMQIYREKYKKSALYKMGFLFNKADNAAKTFGKFSHKAYRDCLLAREHVMDQLYVFDMLSTNERQLNLWFSVEILADLITENDIIAKQVFKNTTDNRTLLYNKLFID